MEKEVKEKVEIEKYGKKDKGKDRTLKGEENEEKIQDNEKKMHRKFKKRVLENKNERQKRDQE